MQANRDGADADTNAGKTPTMITLAFAKDFITVLLPEAGVGGRRVRRPRTAVRIVIDQGYSSSLLVILFFLGVTECGLVCMRRLCKETWVSVSTRNVPPLC